MKRILCLVLIALFAVSSMAFSAKVGTFGVPNSSGVAPLEVDSDRAIVFAADSSIKMPYYVLSATTGTLTWERLFSN